VLTDRYYFSTAAYQGAAGMDPGEIFARNAFAPRPDMVIMLTMRPEISLVRIRESRGEELNDFEQEEQLRRVAELFASFDDPCIRRIAADAPLGNRCRGNTESGGLSAAGKTVFMPDRVKDLAGIYGFLFLFMFQACIIGCQPGNLTATANSPDADGTAAETPVEEPDYGCAYFYFLWGRQAELAMQFAEALEAYEKALICDPEADYILRKIPVILCGWGGG
jgi:hypothetical protein